MAEDKKHTLPFKGEEIEKAISDVINGFVLTKSQDELEADMQKAFEEADSDLKAGIEEELRKEFAAADESLKLLLQAEIDGDVKVEADRAVAEEAKIREEFVAADEVLKEEMQEIVDQIKEKVGDPAVRDDAGVQTPASGLFARVDALEDIDHDVFVVKEDGKSLVEDAKIAMIHEDHNHDDLAVKADVEAALLEKAAQLDLEALIARVEAVEALEARIAALEAKVVAVADVQGLQAALDLKADGTRCDDLADNFNSCQDRLDDIEELLANNGIQ